jgi:excisionase family DNA binding protein
MNVSEVAEFLGLSKGTMYHLISQQRVPCIHLSNRCIRFRREDILAWISGKCVPPVASDAEEKKSR